MPSPGRAPVRFSPLLDLTHAPFTRR
jgi:hypothetical protein